MAEVSNTMTECACNKIRYASKRRAKLAIRQFEGRRGRLHAYRCEAGFWHIGHMPPNLRAGKVSRRALVARRIRRAP